MRSKASGAFHQKPKSIRTKPSWFPAVTRRLRGHASPCAAELRIIELLQKAGKILSGVQQPPPQVRAECRRNEGMSPQPFTA